MGVVRRVKNDRLGIRLQSALFFFVSAFNFRRIEEILHEEKSHGTCHSIFSPAGGRFAYAV
jgi:hypothetical protein